MAYKITSRCIRCDDCLPQCPTGAIKTVEDGYWIDPILCNNCQDYYPEPLCVSICPVDSPVPFQAKKGRCKTGPQTVTSPDLFPNQTTHPFASAIVVWELCSILTQRHTLPWQVDESGELYYHRTVNRGQGAITFHLSNPSHSQAAIADPLSAIAAFDIRSACLHLIYAAHATTLETPWNEEFVINDQQIERYLGLDKRKDLSKLAKLSLIKDLAQQPCQVSVSIDWSQQGKMKGFSLSPGTLWHMKEIEHHFQEDELGCKHLVGLTFRVKPGLWTQHFLNQQGYKERTAFYQYGILPKSLLHTVMSIWQQHEGAVRMMLWLLFKTKIGKEQRITVPTLMRVGYGEEKVKQANVHREIRKRLLRTFECDLEVLHHYGLKPIFDPVTYPSDIQPLWAKIIGLPDDAEAALEFWTNDGSHEVRLTDSAPRGKWNRLMHARFLHFELPKEWDQRSVKSGSQKQRRSHRKLAVKTQPSLSGGQITAARQRLQISQRMLAEQVGKSQSWIRDVEKGRLQANLKDQARLRKALKLP